MRKLTALCAKSEHSSSELEQKMRQWGLEDDDTAYCLEYLNSHHYVDDVRFCEAFVRDKMTYNHWGRRKIEQALWAKRVPESIYGPVLDAISDNSQVEALTPILQAKMPTIKAASERERVAKLIRFALGRGFSYDVIQKSLGNVAADIDGSID